ncbi:hypothetical protein HDU87_004680 [Geranomyces variabilis]|uniref:Protein YOP1 n=1 Tax=Geranomyces variabilis TaxID=109894 RepID=A0AAD5TIE2_9FUNG|nr:hypothetical protein HDU87_004680 [Geranomyces variabilis]
MPLYYETKLLIILWLVLPYTQGSHFVYRHLLRPALDEHERDIDAAMSQAQVAATQWALEKWRGIMAGARNAIAQAVFNGQFSLFANQVADPHRPVPPATSPGSTRRRRPRPRIVEVDDDGDSIDDSDASYTPPPKSRTAAARRRTSTVIARSGTRRTRQSRGSVVKAAANGSGNNGSGSSARASRASRGSEDVVSDDDG